MVDIQKIGVADLFEDTLFYVAANSRQFPPPPLPLGYFISIDGPLSARHKCGLCACFELHIFFPSPPTPSHPFPPSPTLPGDCANAEM